MMALNTKCRNHGSDHPDMLCPYIPEPCGCVYLSDCCAAPDVMSDAGKDNPVGICARCQDHAGFSPSEEDTWKYLGQTLYGDDADGNRGVPLRTWVCTECGEEIEVIG